MKHSFFILLNEASEKLHIYQILWEIGGKVLLEGRNFLVAGTDYDVRELMEEHPSVRLCGEVDISGIRIKKIQIKGGKDHANP